jgi:hypothetical protein
MLKIKEYRKLSTLSLPFDYGKGTGKKGIFICFLNCTFLLFFSVFSYAQSSVLATGEWYKIATTRTGVHKIDVAFLKDVGIDVTKLNPQNIRIFGNGSGLLPQTNNTPRAKDLIENLIEIIGENDGKFDASDYILFYAESPHKILYNTTNQQFIHQNNPYSDTTFVFLNISDIKGLRIKNQTLVNISKNVMNGVK